MSDHLPAPASSSTEMQRNRALLLFFITASALPLGAQSPEDRMMLSEWETRVDGMEAQGELTPLIDSTSTPMAFLRRGFVLRRLGQITGNRRYFDQALEYFWLIASEHRDWPYAWYGLGSTKLAMDKERLVPYSEEHQPEGSSYAEEAGVALERALKADQDFAPARLALAGASEADADPGAMLGLARLRREAGDLDSAVTLLGHYLRQAGDSGVGYLELARTLFEAGHSDSATNAYYSGAARIGSKDARLLLRDDLAWLADSAELSEFDRKGTAQIRSWVDAFWERRDVRDARSPGERLAEHYRRVVYAERHFARVSDIARHTRGQRYRSHQTRLDDRAVIYIRHGEPDDRASFASPYATAENVAPQKVLNPDDGNPAPRPDDRTPSVPPNLSWKYNRRGGSLIFHFVAEFGSDYRLIESLMDVFSTDTAIGLQMSHYSGRGETQGRAFDPARFARALVDSRAALDAVYARLANTLSIQGSSNLQLERQAGQRSLAIGTTTDSYVHPFGVVFEPVVQAFGIWRESSEGVLVVTSLPRRAGGITARLVISSEDDRREVQLDTVLRLEADATAKGRIAGYVELPAVPGRHRLRALLVDSVTLAGGDGQVDVTLSDPSGGGLVLSDLVIGVPVGLTWSGPDGPVRLNPSGAFTRDATMELYYEVAGLTAGSSYQTTIEVRRRDREETRRIRSTFETAADKPRQSERRQVLLRGLGSGQYLLVVTVTGPGGTAASRHSFRVR